MHVYAHDAALTPGASRHGMLADSMAFRLA